MSDRITALAFLAIFTVGLLIAQNPSAVNPVIRLSVSLVQIDAVVTDGSGKHVANPGAADFAIFEDGKLQRITQFSFIGPGKAVALPALGVPKTNTVPLARSIVLFADDLGRSNSRSSAS